MSRQDWLDAIKGIRNLRVLVIAALMTALVIVLGYFYIPVTENLRIMLTFIPMAFGGMLCGPVMGVLIGLAGDLIGFFIHPSGPFFFGYTISAMLSGFVYGLFLYHKEIAFWRIILTKAIINLFINVGLGCLWSMLLYGKAYWVAFSASIVKNLLLLPAESWVLFLIARALKPLLHKFDIGFKSMQ